VRLGLALKLHGNNSLTERITDIDLSTLVLVRVEPIELLELVVDELRHRQADIFEGRPVGCLKALDTEVEVGGWSELICCSAEVRLILLSLFFAREIV